MSGGSGGSGSGGRSGSGGGGSTNGDAGQPGEVVRASNQMLENLRSGKLSQRDAEAAADALLTASMKSKNPDEIRAIGKKYSAVMDAIDAYNSGKAIETTATKSKSSKQDNDSRYSRNPDGTYKKNW